MSTTLIEEYLAAKEELTVAKAKELDLRNRVALLAGAKPAVPGTYKAEVGPFAIAVACKFNVKVDEEALDQAWASLTPHVRDDVITVKHSLNKREYDKLTINERRVLDSCITKTSAAPQVTIKEKA